MKMLLHKLNAVYLCEGHTGWWGGQSVGCHSPTGKNKGLMWTRAGMTLEDSWQVREARHKRARPAIYMTSGKEAHLFRQKVDEWLPGTGLGARNGYKWAHGAFGECWEYSKAGLW